MTKGARSRSLLGWVITSTRRVTPRLERLHAQLPASAGLAADSDEADHEVRLVRYLQFLADHTAQLPDPPRFTVLLDGELGSPESAQTLASLRLQVWPHWEVSAAGPGAPDPDVVSALGDRLRLTPWDPDPQNRLDAGFDQASGDYVLVLTAGDRLYPSALAEIVRALDLERRLGAGTPRALYFDERTIADDGSMRGDPVLKPGWSPRLLRGGDYLGAAVYERGLLAELSGPAHSPAGRHALALAAGDRDGFHHVPHVLVQRREAPRTGAVPAPPAQGRVSVVIPTRDHATLLEACVTSVLDRTRYPDLEVVVVDNGSTDPAALRVLDALSGDSRVTVLPAPGPFNFARLCNQGVAAATGDVIILLNNDTEVLSADWADHLAGWALDAGVGAVGAQLRYPDGRIQHAGLAGLGHAGTGHLFVARDPQDESPLGLAGIAREVLAVTGACLAVRRDLYLEVGGLDEWVVPNDSGDVDLCLRLRQQGLVNVYAPGAVLVHHESPSRGRSFVDFERFYLQRRWPAELLADPYLNPHLARGTRYEADPRFGLPEIPPATFTRWLDAGHIPGITTAAD